MVLVRGVEMDDDKASWVVEERGSGLLKFQMGD